MRIRGFTLIELLVTLAIAAILLTVGAPSFARFVANSQLTAQTNDLVSATALARSEAIRRNRSITLCRAEPGGDRCASGTLWRSWILLDGDDLLRRGQVDAPETVLQVRSQFPGDTVRFRPDGTAALASGVLANDEQFRICSTRLASDNLRVLALGPSGRLSSQRATDAC